MYTEFIFINFNFAFLRVSLSNKINLIIIVTLVITLTGAFWFLTDIESDNLKKQINQESDTVINLMSEDINKMFSQINEQKNSLQDLVNKVSEISGVEYIQVFDLDGYYIAATQQNLIGQKAEDRDLSFVRRVIESKQSINEIKEKEGFFELERHIPIKLDTKDQESKIINVIETEVKTESKSSADMREAERLLQMISAGVEQSARSVIATRDNNLQSLQSITDNMMRFGFFHDVFVFDDRLSVIAATMGESGEPEEDPEEYKQIRRDVVEGKKAFASYDRVHEDYNNINVRVVPVYLNLKDQSGIIGLIEIHIFANAFQEKIDALRMRMAIVAVALIMVLAVVLTLFLRRTVVSPIKNYSMVAQKVAAGDLNQRIEKISRDEIGKFGEVFNLMVSNLRELDRLKSEFISVAAHQLRTPLSAVKWAVKMVMDGDAGPITEEQKNMLDQGYKSNERMVVLINDLLDVSRIEAGKFEYEFIDGQVEDLVDTTVQEFKQIIKHKSINLKYHKPDNSLPKVKMDSLKLKMVIENLIDNAVKYTAPGGNVDIVFKYYRNIIETVVSDSGVGIPKDQFPQLFSKFFRAKNVVKMQTDGTGLGLFIVKKIVEKHGGIIWAESEEGKGTSMHFTLPTSS